MKIDKDADKIGLVPRGVIFSERQLERQKAMTITIGESKSFITILGPNTNSGRLRVRHYQVANVGLAQEARRACEKQKILRANVEIIHP